MKPFVSYTALVLAIIFIAGAALAWAEVLREGDLLANPKVKPAAGFLVTGMMFAGLALRGWRSGRKTKTASDSIKP